MRSIIPLAILLTSILLLLVPFAYAATVTRTMPAQVKPGTTFNVDLVVTGATAGQTFTIEENHPLQIDIIDWSVEGAKEPKDAIDVRIKGQGFGWSFTPSWSSPTIHYTAKVSPTATGDLAFEAVYFDPSGFNKLPGSILVSSSDPPAKDTQPKPLETSAPNSAKGAESPSGAATSAPPGTGQGTGSMVIGILIALAILIVGLGVFYAVTRRSPKNKNPFKNDSFFRK